MDSLLEDWVKFCEGKVFFDKSHFLGLLKSHRSHADICEIFSFFPFAEDLVRRLEEVFSFGDIRSSLYLLPNLGGGEGEIIELGGRWLKEQERVCGLLGDSEILGICKSAKVKYVDQVCLENELRKDIPHHWFFGEVGDAVSGSMISDSDQFYALFEALYGVAADYYLSWYVARPLFSFGIDLGAYFEFWRAGGKCALTEDFLLVSC